MVEVFEPEQIKALSVRIADLYKRHIKTVKLLDAARSDGASGEIVVTKRTQGGRRTLRQEYGITNGILVTFLEREEKKIQNKIDTLVDRLKTLLGGGN